MNKKVLLMILDGWGEGKHDWTNAIFTQGAVSFAQEDAAESPRKAVVALSSIYMRVTSAIWIPTS